MAAPLLFNFSVNVHFGDLSRYAVLERVMKRPRRQLADGEVPTYEKISIYRILYLQY